MVVTFESVKQTIDNSLDAFFAEKIADALVINPTYQKLWEMTRDVAMAGGKRLRPYLVCAAYGRVDERILPVATATELLHVAVLIHDDIIDRDDIRHGQPTLVKSFSNRYKDLLTGGELRHFSQSSALLGGDLLLSEAHAMVATSLLGDDIRRQASKIFAHTVYEVVAGELMDTENAFLVDRFDPLLIYKYKTAGYSFVRPLELGAICAGLDENALATLRKFGQHAGVAFQLQDDALGVFGDELQTGKSVSADLQEAKYTYLVQQFFELATAEQATRFEELFGKTDAVVEEFQEMRSLISISGATEKNNQLVKYHLDAARQTLDQLSSDSLRNYLLILLNKLDGRKA